MYKITIILSALAIFIAGCSLSDIKSEYPEIQFYSLEQAPLEFDGEQLPVTLQVRNFSLNSEYDTDHIIAGQGESKVKRYFYHRWISEPSGLVTDFYIARFSNSKLFKSVLTPVSMVPPDYVITGQVIKFNGFNDPDDDDDSYSAFSVKLNLIRRDPETAEESIIFSKVYNSDAPRGNDNIRSLPVALSKAVSSAADESLKDITTAISEIIASGTYTNKEEE